eukprot:3232915-Amphidinium_carterae.4
MSVLLPCTRGVAQLGCFRQRIWASLIAKCVCVCVASATRSGTNAASAGLWLSSCCPAILLSQPGRRAFSPGSLHSRISHGKAIRQGKGGYNQ